MRTNISIQLGNNFSVRPDLRNRKTKIFPSLLLTLNFNQIWKQVMECSQGLRNIIPTETRDIIRDIRGTNLQVLMIIPRPAALSGFSVQPTEVCSLR